MNAWATARENVVFNTAKTLRALAGFVEVRVTAQIQPVEVFDLVIFGGTGDLALRKLLPALFHRFADGQIAPGSRVVGLSVFVRVRPRQHPIR